MSGPLRTGLTRANSAIEGRGEPFRTARIVLPPFPPQCVPTGPDTGTLEDRNHIFFKIALTECHNFGVRIHMDLSFELVENMAELTGREGVVLHMHTKLPFKPNCFNNFLCWIAKLQVECSES